MTNVRIMGVWERLRRVAGSESSSRAVMWVLLVAIVVVVGWFGWWLVTRDDEPKVNSKAWNRGPYSSSSPAPSTPGPSREAPPQLPPAVSQPTREGVEAAVRFENDAINYAQRTRDVEPLKQVYDLEFCAVCQGMIDTILKGGENGQYLIGGQYTITKLVNVAIYPADDGSGRGGVHVTIRRAGGSRHERDGSLIKSFAADSGTTFSLQLAFDSGRWRIYASSVVKEQS